MTWNGAWPLGNLSVKANRAIGNDNMSYIQVTMGNSIVGTNTSTTRDHFWNVGANEDGHHRFIQSPGFTVGGNAADPLVGTGMNAVMYLKNTRGTPNDTPQWFTRTDALSGGAIYQVTPTYVTGVINMPNNSSYATLINVPINVIGEIYMFTAANGRRQGAKGYFRSSATICDAWALYQGVEGGAQSLPLKFGNGSDASLLTIQVRNEDAANGQSWFYFITYRAI